MHRSAGLLFTSLSTAFLGGCTESIAPRPYALETAHVCAGISEDDASAFLAHLRPDIERVEAIRERPNTKPFVERPVGADVYVRASRGMTAQWLARLTQCHQERDGRGASCASSECPLALAHVTTAVAATSTGFVIAIRSNDFEIAREIGRRAKVLLEAPSDASGDRQAAAPGT